MEKLANKRTKLIALPAILFISSVTMLWLLWRHPIGTVVATIVVLAAFAVSARLTRWVDGDSLSNQRNQRI